METLDVFVAPGEAVCVGLPVEVLLVLTEPVIVFEIVDVFVEVGLDVVVLESGAVSVGAELVEAVFVDCAVTVSTRVCGTL